MGLTRSLKTQEKKIELRVLKKHHGNLAPLPIIMTWALRRETNLVLWECRRAMCVCVCASLRLFEEAK